MDPTDSNVLWAATSEGLYKTTDGGANWTLSHASLMAMDVVIDPNNPQKVYVSHGQLNSTPDPGHLPLDRRRRDLDAARRRTADYQLRPLAARDARGLSGFPRILYAGVSNANSRQIVGLFQSTNEGTTWTNVTARTGRAARPGTTT